MLKVDLVFCPGSLNNVHLPSWKVLLSMAEIVAKGEPSPTAGKGSSEAGTSPLPATT